MSVKGQLTACRDFLMVGMRASARGSVPNETAAAVIRACLDLVEQLVRQSENVTAGKVTKARCAIIGDQFTWRFLENELAGETKATMNWAFTRKGGIGFQVYPGAKLRLTKLKIKILQ